MIKLNLIAEKENGWLLVTKTLIEDVPVDNALGPSVITLFLDESPLPSRDVVTRLLNVLELSADDANSMRAPRWHRNVCIVIGALSDKFAGMLACIVSCDC